MATIKELEDFKVSDAVKFNDELNPLLWEDEKLRSEIRKQLLKIADNFAEYLGLEDLKIEDITISGSNAAYTWTQHSDIDLHLLVDFSNLPHNSVYQELFTAKKTIYNDTHDITVRGLPVELYVQDTNETHHSMGTYSIKNDEWISIPKKEKPNFDEAATKLKYEKLGDMIELALKTKDLEKVKKVLSLIKRYRKAGLDKNGEFGPENISFKAVRKQGLVQKLFDLKAELQSKELSINEYAQNSEPINPKKEFPITVYIYSIIHNKTIRLMGERLGKLTPSGNIKTQFVLPNSDRKIVEWIPVVDKKYPTGQLSDNVHVRSSQKPNKVVSDGAFEFWAYLPKLEEGSEYNNSGLRYYKNPTSKQLFNLVKKSKHNHMRGMYLPGTGRTFWWDASDAIHKAAAEELGLEYSYLNRMEAAIDSISEKYYVGGDENVPDEIIQKYDIENELVAESSGYIPSESEKNEPQFKTALTVDTNPDAIKKNAKAFGWKPDRAGNPLELRANGKMFEKYIFQNTVKSYKKDTLTEKLMNEWNVLLNETHPLILYHGTTTEALQDILENGLEAPSYWGTKEEASLYDQGVMLAVPISRFELDGLMANDLLYQSIIDSGENIPEPNNWQESLEQLGSVRYDYTLYIDEDNIIS